jgi:hypothetical protein
MTATASSQKPVDTAPPAETSAVLRKEFPDSAIRRGMLISAAASGLGATFFAVVQGAVFNFFLEDLSLRERLPYFMGLWCVGGLGTLAGSWIQHRWNCRKALFLWGIGGSRVTWLLIGLIPVLWPDLAQTKPAFVWLTILTLFFYFIHALGSNAWLAWMADLVPSRLSAKYWSLRQVWCAGASAAARLGFGYYLELHRNFDGYALVFICAAVIGIIDALMFIFVAHPTPKVRPQGTPLLRELASRLRESVFRRFCAVYMLWGLSNCIMGPTIYYFMRDQGALGVKDISTIETLSLLAFVASIVGTVSF